MITQKFKNGETEIKVEHAESIEDAEKNGFSEGLYSRFYVNGKIVTNYMAMVQHIVDETKRTGNRFVPPTRTELKELQKKAVKSQADLIRKQFEKQKELAIKSGSGAELIKQFDEAMEKIDLAGVRVVQ